MSSSDIGKAEAERLKRNAWQLAYYHRNKTKIGKQLAENRRLKREKDPVAFKANRKATYEKRREFHCARVREARKANPERYRELDRQRLIRDPDRTRRNNFKRSFGITIEEYDALFAAQKGVCAACGLASKPKKPKGKPIRLAVDHCHKTRFVRGLLCANCNVALGMVNDDISKLKALIEYLESHTTQE